MSLNARKLDLKKFKELYVKKRIKNGNYELLSNNIAINTVMKIKCFGNLNNDEYEHGFLYLTKGSGIKNHAHTENIEMYRFIYGDEECINNAPEICLINNRHQINTVKYDTIIETFKLNKNTVNDINDITILNECLSLQLTTYMWRLDELLNRLSQIEDYDLGWRPNKYLCYIYDITNDKLEEIKNIYFNNLNNIPYTDLSQAEICYERKWNTIPCIVENIYKYKLEEDSNNKKKTLKI